jgi:hypothetical protein
VLYTAPQLEPSKGLSQRFHSSDGQQQQLPLQGQLCMLDTGSIITIMGLQLALQFGLTVHPDGRRVTLALGADGSVAGVARDLQLVLCTGTLMEAVVNLPEVWITDVPGPYALLLGQSALGPLGAAVDPATRQCTYRPYIAQPMPAVRNLVWSLPLVRKDDIPQAASLMLDDSGRLPVHSAPPQLICCTLQPPPQQQQPDYADTAPAPAQQQQAGAAAAALDMAYGAASAWLHPSLARSQLEASMLDLEPSHMQQWLCMLHRPGRTGRR